MLLSTLAFTPLVMPPQSPWNDDNNNSDRHPWETYSRGVVATVPSVGVLLLRMLQLLSPPFGIWPSNNPGHGTTTERFSGGSGSSSDSAAASSALSAVARVPAVYGTKQNKQGKDLHTCTHRMEWSKIDRNETIGCDWATRHGMPCSRDRKVWSKTNE